MNSDAWVNAVTVDLKDASSIGVTRCVSWKMRNLWNGEEEEVMGWLREKRRETSTSITSPLFHYWSKSEGWWRVGQFPQTPSGCPWKWQIVRLIVLGSWPFRGNEPLYLEQKSIKPLHFHSALSSVPIQWGMVPGPHGRHSQAFRNAYCTYSICCGGEPSHHVNSVHSGAMMRTF